MKSISPFMQTYEELPTSLPIFPLKGTVLLPGNDLPLNIFEPRYLDMVRDAMRTHQLIGMIQPNDNDSPPRLYQVGCVGRITSYTETSDGRIEIVLSGLCRFAVHEELASVRAHRIIAPDWQHYKEDFSSPSNASSQSQMLFNSGLKRYFATNKMEVDWNQLEKLEFGTLVDSLIMQLPLPAEDKQILLEAHSQQKRVSAFTAILEGIVGESSTQH